MNTDNNQFDLSEFLTASFSVGDNVCSQSLRQQSKYGPLEEQVEEILKKDPRDLMGLNSFGKPRKVPESTIGTPIQEFYRGKNVLITGGTGFVGKLLIEKLLRSIPHLDHIYVLIRAKKGVSAKERFEKLLEDEVFGRMKTEMPDYQRKLMFVEGDVCEPELGLSETDRQTLHQLVHIVFHSAADVRFVNSLRAAVNVNLLGSKRLIDLAKGMKNLKTYVHVSTAFSHCVRRVVEEKVYKMSVSYNEIIKILENRTDDEIKHDEDRILQGWPNTYTFSKALCEDMISEEAKDLPICIFRPSIVGPTCLEPVRLWTDNLYGPIGLLLAINFGVFHVVRMDDSLPLDMVPADFVVNAMIAVAWENANDRISDMPVYNYTSSPRNHIIWKRMIQILRYNLDVFPLENAIWYPSCVTAPCSFVEKVGIFFLHKIPGYFLDKIAVAMDKQPRLTKIYDKLSLLKDKLDYFIFGTWEFRSDNTFVLRNKLCEEDQRLFTYDITKMNVPECITLSRLSIKYFYLKESLESMPAAARKMAWLKVAHYSLLTMSGLAVLKLLVTLAHFVPI